MPIRFLDALYGLTWATMIALPLVLLWTIATGAVSPAGLMSAFPTVALDEPPSQARAWSVWLVGVVPWVVVAMALWHLQALLLLFRRGQALTATAARRIGGLGALLMGVAALGVAAHTLQLLLLTWTNPPGQRVLSIQIDGGDVGFLLAGGLLLVIGRAMSDAARAVDENRGFV